MNTVHKTKKQRLIERARRDILAALERDGIVSIPESEPTKTAAGDELVSEGLAVVKERKPLPRRWTVRSPPRASEEETGAAYRMTLVLLPAPNVVGTTVWLIASGRLKPGQKAPTLPTDSVARALGIDTTGPEFEALCDALLSRLMPRVIEALRPPAAADLTADEDLLRAIDGRTGFTMDQVLAWMGWPLDRPALRTHVGHALTRLGYGRSRTKGPLGDLRRTYNSPEASARSEVADEFADRLAGILENFTRLTQAEVAKLLDAPLDHSLSVKIGRAMPRIGFKKKVRLQNTPDKYVEYVRERGT